MEKKEVEVRTTSGEVRKIEVLQRKRLKEGEKRRQDGKPMGRSALLKRVRA